MDMNLGVTTPGYDPFGVHIWNILDHTYHAMAYSERALIWHAVLPAETVMPTHAHPTQDEWMTVLSGEVEVDFLTDEGYVTRKARPAETVRMPMGIAHAVFNRSGSEATAVCGVAPTGKLYEMFRAIHGVSDPREFVRIAARHDVDFLRSPE